MSKQRTGWRQFQRVIPSPSAPVRVDVASRSGLTAEASDISEGGMELRYEGGEAPQVGDPLTLLLHLPMEAPVRVRAKVRYVDDARLGLAFIDLTPGGQEALQHYVQTSSAGGGLWKRLRELWQG